MAAALALSAAVHFGASVVERGLYQGGFQTEGAPIALFDEILTVHGAESPERVTLEQKGDALLARIAFFSEDGQTLKREAQASFPAEDVKLVWIETKGIGNALSLEASSPATKVRVAGHNASIKLDESALSEDLWVIGRAPQVELHTRCTRPV